MFFILTTLSHHQGAVIRSLIDLSQYSRKTLQSIMYGTLNRFVLPPFSSFLPVVRQETLFQQYQHR